MAFINTAGKRDGALARLLQTTLDALRERRAYNAVYRQTWRELSALSERELADLGIARSEIGALSQDAAARALHRR